MDGIRIGDAYATTVIVAEEQSAAHYGNEGVHVVATPALIGMIEMAGVHYLRQHIGPDRSSVGVRVEVDHLAAAPLGAEVEARVTVTGVDRGRVSFDVEASWDGTILMRGSHVRAVVELERFLSSLPPPVR